MGFGVLFFLCFFALEKFKLIMTNFWVHVKQFLFTFYTSPVYWLQNNELDFTIPPGVSTLTTPVHYLQQAFVWGVNANPMPWVCAENNLGNLTPMVKLLSFASNHSSWSLNLVKSKRNMINMFFRFSVTCVTSWINLQKSFYFFYFSSMSNPMMVIFSLMGTLQTKTVNG